ncbi:MAG: leucine-rich repeat protein [Candidatus Borkfalkiaceae bacterium]|nr:leucine-rich repeat protein [Clostridia bacterium]MDY6223886.1 leucine-rich repeat protein [Christensenellaceae bacterium]
MKRRFLTLIFTITAMLTCIFGLSACGKVDFKVNFVVDGEVYATLSTNGEEVIKMPENPTKDDYVFDGWYWDKDTWQTPFTANSLLDAPLSSDMNVYCKWKPKQEESGEETKSEETNTGLSFKTLTVDGTNVYGKVSNATETFSFLEEVTSYGLSKCIVALDIYGAQQVATKTIALNVGDNTAYVIETIDGETVKVYTVTVRRRPVYTVSFETEGDTAVQSQWIEEDSCARVPETTPERLGYTFEKWDYDFSQSVTANLNITAEWQANTDTKYRVEYYLQNLANDFYTLQNSETENLTGTTDTTATAEIKTFAHFTHKTGFSESGNINGDGSTVLKVYYTRDTYTVTFDGNGGRRVSGRERQTVKYGGSVTAPTYTRTGYTFNGYDKTNYTNIGESFTVTALWTINQYTLTIVYGNGQENKVITQDYNTPIESIANPESRAGYDFAGWDKTMPITMPAENLTVTAKWNAIFTLSNGTVTGLTDHGKNNYTKLNIPSKIDGVAITAIGDSAFTGCSSLISVTIPDGVTSIGRYAFNNCNSLTSVMISNSVTSIGSSAFSRCSSLEEITISFVGAEAGKTASDTYQYPFGYIFGTSSYSGSTAVTQYYYGSSTSSTTSTTYYIPSSLRKVTVTGGNILYGAFYNCSSLTSVTIGNSVTSIGSYAFRGCSSLTSVTIGNSVTSIGSYAFRYCSSLKSVTIGNSITSIGSSAFDGCSSLTSVTIGNGVTSIGSSAFYDCSSLTSIIVAEGNPSYQSIDGNLYTKDGTTLIQYAIGKTATTFAIPDGVTSIGSSAFSNCSSLTSVTIGNRVTSIGSSAFSNCCSLTSVTIPNSVTSIGSYAFSSCSSLTSVTIGNSVTSIGSYAFSYCRSLTSVTIPNSVKNIGGQAFYGCSSLTSVTIPNSVTRIGSYAISGCNRLTRIIYKGTTAQWASIRKQSTWDENTPSYTVQCTDGTIK